MAIYSKLSINAGGGIISTQQQAKQVSNTATILIGLGGTGMDCLKTLKTEVYERLMPDDPDAVRAEYSHIRFIGVDSDKSTRGEINSASKRVNKDALLSLDPNKEYFSIGYSGDMRKLFDNPKAFDRKTEFTWLRYDKIDAPALSDQGAAGVRQVGRFMMMDKANQFMSKLREEIKIAKTGLQNPSVSVHIFAGLSGGTGSGTFLDVCYMTKHIAKEVGDVKTYGYFFLPDVNLDRIPNDSTDVRKYIPKNGYAAMQELDYCMNLKFNGGSFVQDYGAGTRIKWDEAPVDMCHLVCATNAKGDVIANAYNYAMNVTAEYVMNFLTESTDPENFSLKSHLGNFENIVNQADSEKLIGSSYRYLVIGASCANIPLREINTYLASELFKEFSTIGGNVPSQMDVETLAVEALGNGVKSVGDIYESLLNEIVGGPGTDFEFLEAYPDDWKFVMDAGNSEMYKHYEAQTSKKKNILETNSKSMTSPDNEESLIARVKKLLIEASKDINRGPMYAGGMISSAEKNNLMNIVDGIKAENKSRREDEAAQASLRERDLENARADFENRTKRSFMDNDAKRYDDYIYYREAFDKHRIAMERYKEVDRVLDLFSTQLQELSTGYFTKLCRVMGNLIDTFQENRDSLENDKVVSSSKSYVKPMMTITELKKTLDAAIEKINIPGMMTLFMTRFVENEDAWIQEDENKISKLVNDFFVKEAFGQFSDKTITSYLKDKYDITDDESLTNKVFDEWINPLTDGASPLFYYNEQIRKDADTTKIAFMSVPAGSGPIYNAAQMKHNISSLWTVNKSTLTDRIFVMCSACGLPLSAYNKCQEFEKAYFESSMPGRHYYEGKEVPGMEFNDWTKLPSITPQSLMDSYAPQAMVDMTEEARRLFEEALSKGILTKDKKVFTIDEATKTRVLEAINQAEEKMSKASKPADIPMLKEEQEKISNVEISLSPVNASFAVAGAVGNDEVQKDIFEDQFVSAPAYQQRVKESLATFLELREKLDNTNKALSDKADNIQSVTGGINDFFDALFSGVIQAQGKIVSYKENVYGVEKETVLSRRDDSFKFNRIPIYQGYVSYMGLDNEVRKKIKDEANDRIERESKEMKDACDNMKDMLTADRMSGMAQNAQDFAECNEILDFISKLGASFERFLRDNY